MKRHMVAEAQAYDAPVSGVAVGAGYRVNRALQLAAVVIGVEVVGAVGAIGNAVLDALIAGHETSRKKELRYEINSVV